MSESCGTDVQCDVYLSVLSVSGNYLSTRYYHGRAAYSKLSQGFDPFGGAKRSTQL